MEYKVRKTSLIQENRILKIIASNLIEELTEKEFHQVFQWQKREQHENGKTYTCYQLTFLNIKLTNPSKIRYQKKTLIKKLLTYLKLSS